MSRSSPTLPTSDPVAAPSGSWFGAGRSPEAVADLAAPAPTILDLPHAEATRRLEMPIRASDPSISRATHVPDLRIVDARRKEGS